MLFSVIVPVYNAERFLEQCIRSVLAQTYQDYELILVDDGSRDDCASICDEAAERDARIKVIHKQNEGVVKARQAGAEIAAGEYLAFVDADDWLDESYLKAFAAVIEKEKPQVICCGINWVYKRKTVSKKIPMRFGIYRRGEMERELFPVLIESEDGKYIEPSLCAKVFQRKLYLGAQLRDIYVDIGEDNACSKAAIYKARSLFFLEECYYFYRRNENSATQSGKPFDWYGPMKIGSHFEEQIDVREADFQNQVYRNVVHNLFNVCVSQFYRRVPYRLIKKDIKEHLAEPYYATAIAQCSYKRNIKGKLALFALRYKLIGLIYLFWVYKRGKSV